MRYCHECGAEVANEDIFCLYCGISLQPVSAVSEDARSAAGDLPENEPTAIEAVYSDELAINPTPQLAVADSLAGDQSGTSTVPVNAALENPPQNHPESRLETAADSPPNHLSGDLAAASSSVSELNSSSSQIRSGSIESSTVLPKTEQSAAEKERETGLNQLTPALERENLSGAPPHVVPETSAEMIAEIVPPPIALSPQNTNNIGENKVSDEDLQPTLIGQSANLLFADEEKSQRVAATSETNEQLKEFPKNRFDTPAISAKPSAEAANEQKIAATVNPDDQFSKMSPPETVENADDVKSAEPVVQSVVAKQNVEVAVLTPRHTENNQPQETPGSKSPKLKPLDVGTLLNNRYKVVRRIGGGGMGAVYLAEDQNLGGVLRAVKEMIQAYVDESQQEKAVADFRRESVLLTQLDHPSIPTIYDYFFDEAKGRFYLVMKYISGGDLAARLRSAPESKLDEGSVTTWALQIADVLDYLHNRQPPIVYRDLKPSNIMLDGASNKAMLIDFGIARWVNKEEKGVTAVGTMGYAPPELFAGNAEPRSDIYSLGATMFHLLTGADPQSNPLLIFDFTKNPRPRQINLMLSVEMEDILLRSVEYNSGLRFESAAKMRDELAKHLEKLKDGRLTFERSNHNLAQVMPIPAQAPPDVPFAAQPQVNMVFCGFCGEKIIATDMFCAYCGAPQGSAPPGVQNRQPGNSQMQQTMLSAKIPSLSPMENSTARLVVLGTSELDAPLFKLEKENNLVGREDRRANIFPEIDLSKFDNKAQVSRRHARIWREGAAYLVEDLKSSNGTVLITDDNQTVRLQANQPHLLQHGDKLKLGDTMLRFYVN